VEVALLRVEAKSGVLEGLENLAYVLAMLFPRVAVDQDIVEVGGAEPIKEGPNISKNERSAYAA
jgi:hypothetical protein